MLLFREWTLWGYKSRSVFMETLLCFECEEAMGFIIIISAHSHKMWIRAAGIWAQTLCSMSVETEAGCVSIRLILDTPSLPAVAPGAIWLAHLHLNDSLVCSVLEVNMRVTRLSLGNRRAARVEYITCVYECKCDFRNPVKTWTFSILTRIIHINFVISKKTLTEINFLFNPPEISAHQSSSSGLFRVLFLKSEKIRKYDF